MSDNTPIILENRYDNAGRAFTPIDPRMTEQLLLDGRKIYKRCCVIVGYNDGYVYFAHADDSRDAGNPPDLYWVPDFVPVTDLW